MKKMLAIILALAMTLCMFAACGSGTSSVPASAAGSTTAPEGETYKIAVILRIGDMYAAWMKAAFEADAAKYSNLEVTVMDNQDDSAKHMELIENCIQQQYDYIVLQGRQGDLANSYQAALDAGIGLIQINFAEEWSYDYMPSILCDDYEMGKIIAERAAEEIPENGTVCILNGPAGIWVSEMRRDGFEDGLLAARSDVTLLDEQDANFVKDTAMKKTEDWIQVFPKIDAIVCASDSMAVGAIEAFKSSGKDLSTCKFYGIDGLTDACMAIAAGEMSCSALQDATQYSKLALDMVEADINGEIDICGGNYEKITYFSPVLLDSTNAEAQYAVYEEQGMVK